MTDKKEAQEVVTRLRHYAHLAHAAAAWGFAGEGYTMNKAADIIEEYLEELEDDLLS